MPAGIVIAADGRASPIGRALGLTRFAPRPRRWAFGAYFDGVAAVGDRGEMHVGSDGYIGIAPLTGGVANVCVVRELDSVRRADLSPSARASVTGLGVAPDVLATTLAGNRQLRDRFAGARRISDVTVLGPLAVDARGAGCPGLLLAGDAAGFVDPMTGDGLRFAFRGGMLAAELALRELETGIPQHDGLATARRREFAGKWRVNRALRALVGSPAGVAFAAGLATIWDLPIRRLVAIAGDIGLAGASETRQPSSGPRLA